MGERHGFTITKKSPNDGAYYIVGKDIKKNILIVSQNKKLKDSKKGPSFAENEERPFVNRSALHCLNLKNANWISKIPEPNKNYTAQIRYHGEFLPCKIKYSTPSVAQVIFTKPVLVASGQSCVVYDKDICLGGGVVVYGLPYINDTRTLNK